MNPVGASNALAELVAQNRPTRRMKVTVNGVTYCFTDQNRVRNLASTKYLFGDPDEQINRTIVRSEANVVLEFTHDFLRTQPGNWMTVTLYQATRPDKDQTKRLVTGALVCEEGVLDHFRPALPDEMDL